ncbi:craniofacial development protein 1-like [Halichondria panicea]|uniref:craniofacial development protein 1-like n=1 Tax=Halichondria panicea TaxID=6063 RepID=UPI00312B3021
MADISSGESDDEEYVPEGASSAASDESEGEWKPGGVVKRVRRSSKPTRRSSRKSVTTTRTRSRRGGIKLSKYVSSDEDDDDDEGEASEGSEADEADEGVDGGDGGDGSEGGDGAGGADDSDTDEEDVATTVAKPSNKNSSRIDDLWASFKEDVGIPAKQEKDASNEKDPVATGTLQAEKEDDIFAKEGMNKTVSIKTKYDFAGEEVEVEKEVRVDSKEAKKFFESQSSTQPAEKMDQEAGLQTGTKRKGSGLGSVLDSIGKKQKMSTLEKSHLDWQQFKTSEGLEDELAHGTKDGYLAKQEFLQRADLRQFELEREQRLKRFKRLH